MNSIIKYLLIFISGCIIASCDNQNLETQNLSDERNLEFIVRTTGFNDVDVATKSDANDFEKAIHNSYILIFDNEESSSTYGSRIYFSGDKGNALQSRITLKSLKKIKACCMANIPYKDVENIKTISDLSDAVLDINYAIKGENGITQFGIPSLDLDCDESTPNVACIPMFGLKEIDVTNINKIEIPIKRLFAKIYVKLELDLSSAADILTNFKLISYEIKNLPKRVRILENTAESSWVKIPEAFETTGDNRLIAGNLTNALIYNKKANANLVSNQSCNFYFYVPEYYLTALTKEEYTKIGYADDTYGTQKYKPKMYDSSKKPIYITLLGQYSPYGYNKVNLTYDIFLGEDEHSSFTLKRNTLYTNTVTITGADNSNTGSGATLDHRVSAVTVNDMVVMNGEAANSYIITTEGKYSLPAVKGAYTNTANAVYCSIGNIATEITKDNNNIRIKDMSYDPVNRSIEFEVSNVADGNVIIGLQNSETSEIEWSWHLWFNKEYKGAESLTSVKTHEYPSGATVMDRNLGASSSTSSGLFYQYGCKNPFIGGKYAGNGTNGANTWDPTADSNSTDNTKSVNDPCPPGYRVPNSGVWSEGEGKTGTTEYLFFYNLNPLITYSYTGYLNASNETIITMTENTTKNASSFEQDESQDINTTTPEESTNKKKQTRYKTVKNIIYYDFVYSVPITNKSGYMWCSNNYAFKYNYRTISWSDIIKDYNSLSIISCKIKTQTVTIKQERTRRFTYIPWNDLTHWWEDVETTPGQWIEEGTITSSNNFSRWKAELAISERNVIFSSYGQYIQQAGNLGMQIRCISE